MSSEPENVVSLPFKWEDNPDVPIVFANQILVQYSSDNEFIVSFGQVAPPPLLSQEQAQRFLDEHSEISVKTVLRLSLTPERVVEFIRVLQANHRNYQEGQARKQGR